MKRPSAGDPHFEDMTFLVSYDTVLINDQPNHLNQNYRCDCTLLILYEFCEKNRSKLTIQGTAGKARSITAVADGMILLNSARSDDSLVFDQNVS